MLRLCEPLGPELLPITHDLVALPPPAVWPFAGIHRSRR